MDSAHITPELLDAIIDHEMPPAVLSRLMWDHVRGLCPVCRENLDRWVQKHRTTPFAAGPAPVPGARRKRNAAAAREERAARRELKQLLGKPASEGLEVIRGAVERFRTPLLVDLLIERLEVQIHDDPREAAHLARLARAVAQRIVDLGGLERRVRATAHLGNALRASGDVLAADRLFREVRDLLGDGSGVDVHVFAEVDRLEAGLRRDQRHYGEAEKLLSRAILVLTVFGDPVGAAKSLLKLAFLRSRTGREQAALAALREALDLLDPERHLSLTCFALHNLVSLLVDTGDFEQAAQVLRDSRDLFERYFREAKAEMYACEYRWLEGRVARGLEDLATAETALREAAEGFVHLEIGYDAALAYLDLAEVYLAQGQVEEVAHLAAAVEPVLKANDLAEEAVAALALFRSAATRKRLSASVLRQVRGRVLRAQGAGEGEG